MRLWYQFLIFYAKLLATNFLFFQIKLNLNYWLLIAFSKNQRIRFSRFRRIVRNVSQSRWVNKIVKELSHMWVGKFLEGDKGRNTHSEAFRPGYRATSPRALLWTPRTLSCHPETTIRCILILSHAKCSVLSITEYSRITLRSHFFKGR